MSHSGIRRLGTESGGKDEQRWDQTDPDPDDASCVGGEPQSSTGILKTKDYSWHFILLNIMVLLYINACKCIGPSVESCIAWMFLPLCQLVLAWVDDSGCLLRQAMANGIFRSTVNIPLLPHCSSVVLCG